MDFYLRTDTEDLLKLAIPFAWNGSNWVISDDLWFLSLFGNIRVSPDNAPLINHTFFAQVFVRDEATLLMIDDDAKLITAPNSFFQATATAIGGALWPSAPSSEEIHKAVDTLEDDIFNAIQKLRGRI
jgi:hypothetical protein